MSSILLRWRVVRFADKPQSAAEILESASNYSAAWQSSSIVSWAGVSSMGKTSALLASTVVVLRGSKFSSRLFRALKQTVF
jgi:hypothetical protein